MTPSEARRLTAVARGAAPADLYVAGGTVLNVYTGELELANVAVAGERIAYVGLREDMIGAGTEVIDATGRVLVPGYIDPHVHAAHLVTPTAFADHVLTLGTTTVFADTLQFWELGGLRAFQAVAAALASSPLKFYWLIRVQAQSRMRGEARRFSMAALRQAFAHPWTAAAGEVTRWPDVHAGDGALLGRLALARAHGLRVEGHTAGAAAEKVPVLAAGGLTSDHEPITAEEVLVRARQGIAVMLRESSLRRDLAGLLGALKQAPALVSRLMLTADGSMPAFIAAHGFVDHLIRVALGQGLDPVDVYRMVSLNPATYYGRDADLGGIAPGRYADLCMLPDLTEPRPETVIARGAVVATGGRRQGPPMPQPDWRRIFASPRARLAVPWRCRPEDVTFSRRGADPVIRLVSTVITRLETGGDTDGVLQAALLDRDGRWVAPALVAGFADRVDGLAATITTDFNIVTLGRSPQAMAQAVNRLLAVRGGIVVVDGDQVALEIPLPVGGIMSGGSLLEAGRSEQALHACLVERGYPYHDPLFTLFFLAADFLPAVRLSPLGVWDVKRARVLVPSRRRRA